MLITATQRYQDTRQQGWLRVASYAEAHATPNGHCPLSAGQLGRQLGMNRHQVSRAIASARREGWLHQVSSARCLVLPGADPHRCAAIHLGGV